VWVDLDPTVGRVQGGRRPAIVVSSDEFLRIGAEILHVVPLTTRNRGFYQHFHVTGPTGLTQDSWAMPEQIQTVSLQQVSRVSGQADELALVLARQWMSRMLGTRHFN
jgi:mRNA interferase MazF